ncbi:MAG: hypothetical protein ABJ004_03935 [Cyclobacteriaceae bacterium]
MYLTLSSEGIEDKATFTASNIRKAAIRFRPGQRLRSLVGNLKFEKSSSGTSTDDVEVTES